MSSSDRYYRPTGAVPAPGTVLMLACGTVAAAALACVYTLLTRYNPLVYVTVLGTCAFGAGIGWAVRCAAKQGKVRNRTFAIIVGAVLGAIGLYLSWAGYLWLFLREVVPGAPMIFDPVFLFGLLQEVAANGPWEMNGWQPVGAQLYAIWAVEAGIVLFLAAATAGSSTIPFCEACDRWTEKQSPVDLAYARPEPLVRDLERERYEILDDLRRGPIETANRLQAIVQRCPQCRDAYYLTIEHIEHVTNANGQTAKKTNAVLGNLRIPEEIAERLHTPLVLLEVEEAPVRAEAEPQLAHASLG